MIVFIPENRQERLFIFCMFCYTDLVAVPDTGSRRGWNLWNMQ